MRVDDEFCLHALLQSPCIYLCIKDVALLTLSVNIFIAADIFINNNNLFIKT